MELMNRALQRDILQKLAAAYPEELEPHQIGHAPDDPAWAFNAMYLAEHDLIDAKHVKFLSEPTQVHLARITAKGLDFLQDDGGLSAVLNVVTVRFEADTLRALIAQHVEESDIPAEDKNRVIDWLKQAGSDALKETTQRLVTAALDHLQDAPRLLPILFG